MEGLKYSCPYYIHLRINLVLNRRCFICNVCSFNFSSVLISLRTLACVLHWETKMCIRKWKWQNRCWISNNLNIPRAECTSWKAYCVKLKLASSWLKWYSFMGNLFLKCYGSGFYWAKSEEVVITYLLLEILSGVYQISYVIIFCSSRGN